MLKSLPVVWFFFSSRRRHTRLQGDWSSDVCSSDLVQLPDPEPIHQRLGHQQRSEDRKSTRLNSSHLVISYAVFCLKKKDIKAHPASDRTNSYVDSHPRDGHGRH